MSRRRVVAPLDQLKQFSASPIYNKHTERNNESNTNNEEPEIIGITCFGGSWDIKTYHSNSISNEHEMEALTTTLQKAAENHKKMWPPEIVFLQNSLVLTYNYDRNSNPNNEVQENGDTNKLEINFNAKSALKEWATAHRNLTLNENEDNQETNSYRGVSVLQTIDAKLWNEKRKQKQVVAVKQINDTSCFNPNLVIKTKDEFHFDWSYSTPYTGSITLPFDTTSSLWMSRETSGINKQLLLDKTQPILFFDDIILYEDDLHDNGEVKLSVKVRIMPTCFYVLQRLFVRVDYVLVRCRDVRMFHEFGADEVMRDITWKEVKWDDDMGRLGLSKDIGCWMEKRIDDHVWGRVPIVDLPDDIPKYSSLSLRL